MTVYYLSRNGRDFGGVRGSRKLALREADKAAQAKPGVVEVRTKKGRVVYSTGAP